MSSSVSNAAILFFTRTPKAEGVSKQFVDDKDDRRNIHIARSLIRRTRNQIRKTGLPVFEINENHQEGASFGERFSNAFKSIFSEGFDFVIAVGNDTPQLKSEHITKAAELLSAGTDAIVVGPSSDGGTWLMGYSEKAFRKHSFTDLPWNTSFLLEYIFDQAGEDLSIAKLDTFTDIDDYRSLLSFIEKHCSNNALMHLIGRIKSILTPALPRINFENSERSHPPTLLTSRRLRAPPYRNESSSPITLI